MSRCAITFEVFPQEAGMRLSVFLRKRKISLSVVRSVKFLPQGLLVNGEQARTSHLLRENDRVTVNLEEEIGFSARPEDLPLQIVYKSADALVINKPAGMAPHPGPSHHSGTLANAVCGYYQQGGANGVFRPVGRLDANTSGLALCAGNAASAYLLGATAQKLYLAVVGGRIQGENGLIDAPLAPKPGSSTAQWVEKDGRPSITRYHVMDRGAKASLVAVLPQTGRTHQIRVHFAYLGHPLLGDALYGGECTIQKRHALHCAGLRFEELAGNRPTLWCGMPPDMQAAAWRMGLEYQAEKAWKLF